MRPGTGDPVPEGDVGERTEKFYVFDRDSLKAPPTRVDERFRDTIDYHSTVVQAAQTAARGRVRTLVLTHQIPTPAAGAADEWINLAREHFDGEIVFGEDLLTISASRGSS